MLADYCNLCTMLPNISVELGLKAAELIKFLNSRICQLVLGAGAISVSGLKTITIRNLALALRSLQLVVNVIPHVLIHFQKCHSERNLVRRESDGLLSKCCVTETLTLSLLELGESSDERDQVGR